MVTPVGSSVKSEHVTTLAAVPAAVAHVPKRVDPTLCDVPSMFTIPK